MYNIRQELRNEFTELIGEVSVKNLFTGYGIFQEDTMFALFQNDAIFVRAEGELVSYFERLGAVAYSLNPNNMSKLALYHYYQLPPSVRKNKTLFKQVINLSIQQIKRKKLSDALAKKERVKELANFTIKHERLLAKINIHTVSDFRSLGAIHSYVRLKKLGIQASIDLLWTFSAALMNKHVNLLTEKEKSSTLTKLNLMLEANGMRKIKGY